MKRGGTDVERGEGRGSGSCEGGRGTRVVVKVEEWIDRMSASLGVSRRKTELIFTALS